MKDLMLRITNYDTNTIFETSKTFLDQNSDFKDEINSLIEAYQGILDLTPFELTNFSSGRNLPFFEGDLELSAAYSLAFSGYYRIAFSTLRNVLELTLISIYYDREGKADEEIEAWVRSKEDTPFLKQLGNKIFSSTNYKNFQELKQETNNLYWELSNYNHTKGIKYSNRKLGSREIIGSLSFNENSLTKFLNIAQQVVRHCLIMNSIKYPIALLDVPIFEKFGFNRPMGYFLDKSQSSLWKNIIGEPYVSKILNFAKTDQETLEAFEHIQGLPNVTDEQIEDQYFNMHKDLIEGSGYLKWSETIGKSLITIESTDNAETRAKKEKRKARFESWANENNCYEVGLSQEERHQRFIKNSK